MTGSVSNPPSERGVLIRRRPVSRSAFKTGWDRRRSRSASSLCSSMIGAISRAASISDVSGSQGICGVPASTGSESSRSPPVRRSDVLVDVEEVVRVIGRLHGRELLVVGPSSFRAHGGRRRWT